MRLTRWREVGAPAQPWYLAARPPTRVRVRPLRARTRKVTGEECPQLLWACDRELGLKGPVVNQAAAVTG